MTSNSGSKKRSGPSRAARRVGRLLALVPYVLEHPGTEITELVTLFGGSERELLADLDMLFVTGMPPYGPSDLVGVDIDDGRVWISMADHFARPLRLTRNEALAIYLRGRAAMEVGGPVETPALRSALAKLEQELGDETIGRLAAVVEAGDGRGAAGDPDVLARLRHAVETHERVRIEYYTASRDEVGERTIDPERLFSQIGWWYLIAWDIEAGDERTFRVDRVRTAIATGETFEPRDLPQPEVIPPQGPVEISLLLAPAARWVAETYDADATEEPDGRLAATIRVAHLPWAAKLVLRLGDEAEVVSPPELGDLVREQAATALKRYT